MSSPAVQRLLQATSQHAANLITGQNTTKTLQQIEQRYQDCVHEGTYLVDPAKMGSERSSTWRRPKPQSRGEAGARLRWCRPLDGSQAQEEAEDDDTANRIEEPVESMVNRYVVTVNGEYYLLQDLLGEERAEAIRALQDIRHDVDLPDPPNAARPRFLWQKTGTKMMSEARKRWGGCLNADEMGFGKTTQAIDDIVCTPRHENDAFNVVCTEKAVVMAWAKEGEMSYTEGNRPRVLILDDSRTSFGKLWEGDYDAVVVSYSALMHQYHKLLRYQKFIGLWRHSGREEALRVANDERLLTKRPTLPLFTALLDMLPVRIPLKVLDEAHRLKLWPGKTRAAVQGLRSETVDLLTGTPCGNVWSDILATCDLLPYEPIRGRTDFFIVFAPVQAEHRHKPPTRTELSNLIRYLGAFTFGRRIDLLDIPEIIRHPATEFELTPTKAQLTLWLIDRFFRCARMSTETTELNQEESRAAMGYCTRAEQESAFPALARYSKAQQDALRKSPIDLKKIENLFMDAVREEQEEGEGHRQLPRWAGIPVHQLTKREFTLNLMNWLLERGFVQYHAAVAAKANVGTVATPRISSNPTNPMFRKRHARPAALQSLQAINKKAYEELIDGDHDDDDFGNERGDPNADRIEPQHEELDEEHANQVKMKIQEFEKHASGLSKNEVFTERCQSLLRLYEHIQNTYPGEKILIWSRFYRALVLIKQAFKRKYNIDVPIYFGELDSKDRSRLLNQWQNEHLTAPKTPLLIQQKAGGVGLTINAASHCIFFEVWWNKQDEAQAERRCVRLGQERQVHIWKLIAVNSFADAIICAGGLRKLKTIDLIMEHIRPADGQQMEIPELVPQYGKGRLGFIDFSYFKEMDILASQEYETQLAEYENAIAPTESKAEGPEGGDSEEASSSDEGHHIRPAKRLKSEEEVDSRV